MTTPTQIQALRSQIAAASDNLLTLCQKVGLQELTQDIGDLIRNMHQGLYRLVVMGEIKKGKSSFINALLGLGDLLPTDTAVATSTVYKIMHGPLKRIKVFFLEDISTGHVPEPLEISEAEISEYGTEKGNKDNIKRVDFIAIEHPAEILRSGLTIVDTPGVGGLYKAHLGVTWKYAPNADAIFFVLDSVESVISVDEIRFLTDLTQKITKRVYFVQTKKDKADREQWQAWEVRNRTLLLEHLPVFTPASLRYFVISSKAKRLADKMNSREMLERSGYSEVTAFLENELMAEKDLIVCREAARTLAGKARLTRNAVVASLQAATAESQERLRELEQQSVDRKNALIAWEETTFKALQVNFRDRFEELKRSAADQLNDILDPTTPELTDFLDDLRKKSISAATLNTQIHVYQQRWIAISAENGKRVITEFNENLMQALSEMLEKLASQINMDQFVARISSFQGRDWSVGVSRHDSLNLNLSKFQSARNAATGISVAAGVAYTLGSLLFPPGAFLAGALVVAAGAAGGKWAHDSLSTDRLNQALAQTERILRETIATVRRNVVRDFQRLATECERQIRDLLTASVRATREQYERELTEIQTSRSSTLAEQKARADSAREQVRLAEEIGRILLAVLEPARTTTGDPS